MTVPSSAGLTRRALLLGTIAACTSVACTRLSRPADLPLRRFYAATPESPEQPPLIFVPGAFGSNLRDTRSGRELWPHSNFSLLFGRYAHLELAIDPDRLEPLVDHVVADDLFTDGLGQDFYGQVLHTLEQAGGFRRRQPGDPIGPRERNYYVFLYDWRLDNVHAADGLHTFIERIRADYGDPGLKVDILAHSNGGLLARYYARYGRAPLPESGSPTPRDPGTPAIRRLLLVGSPNLGTIQPVLSHLRGEEIGLRRIPPDVMATCPGATQLLPHPAVPWLVDLRGRVIPRDVFSIETWRTFGWSIFGDAARRRIVARHGGGAAGQRYLDALERYFARQLARGRRFIEALAAPDPAPAPATYLFGGDCSPTLARLVLERVGNHLHARERPGDIATPLAGVDYAAVMFDPGDLVVTRDSLEGRVRNGFVQSGDHAGSHAERHQPLVVRQSTFLCEEHRQLTGNPSFQDNLLYVLLRDEEPMSGG